MSGLDPELNPPQTDVDAIHQCLHEMRDHYLGIVASLDRLLWFMKGPSSSEQVEEFVAKVFDQDAEGPPMDREWVEGGDA